MKKQAYFKMMGLQKKAGNVAGPFLGGMGGFHAAAQLARLIHKNPGKLTTAVYGAPGLFLGMLAGNKLQNYLQGTNYSAFWDNRDTVQRAINNAGKRLKDEEQDKEQK